MKTTQPQCVSRGNAPLTELQETFSNVLTELADGSDRLPIQVFSSNHSNEMTYVVLHKGVALTLHVQTTQQAITPAHSSKRTAHRSPLTAQKSPLGGFRGQKGAAL